MPVQRHMRKLFETAAVYRLISLPNLKDRASQAKIILKLCYFIKICFKTYLAKVLRKMLQNKDLNVSSEKVSKK